MKQIIRKTLLLFVLSLISCTTFSRHVSYAPSKREVYSASYLSTSYSPTPYIFREFPMTLIKKETKKKKWGNTNQANQYDYVVEIKVETEGNTIVIVVPLGAIFSLSCVF